MTEQQETTKSTCPTCRSNAREYRFAVADFFEGRMVGITSCHHEWHNSRLPLDTQHTALRALVQQWREKADQLDAAAADTMDPCEYAARTGAATMARHAADALATLLGDPK